MGHLVFMAILKQEQSGKQTRKRKATELVLMDFIEMKVLFMISEICASAQNSAKQEHSNLLNK